MFQVNDLFSPLTWADFFDGYFEKKYLRIQRGNPEFYNDLLTMQQVDEVLFSQKVNHPGFRVVDSKTDTYPDPRTYTQNGSSTIDPLEFVKYYTKGGTLAMAAMHQHVHSLRAFCNALHELLGHPTQTNLYLTPADAQGFSPHYDSHDVFVLQVHGSKLWKIYESTIELPDKALAFEKEGFVPGRVIDEFVLEQGDLLYIPRGLVHDAYTTDSSSLHITLGLLGYTWSQYLAEAVIHLAKNDADFRRFVSGKLTANDYDVHAANLLRKLGQELKSRNGFKRFEKQLLAETPLDRRGHLLDVMESVNLTVDHSIIPLEKGVSIDDLEGQVQLRGKGKRLIFPDFCAPVCKFLFQEKNGAQVRLVDLPGELDDEGKIVLVKRLISEGLATLVND